MSQKRELDFFDKVFAATVGGIVGVGVTAVAGPIAGVAAGAVVAESIRSNPQVIDDLAASKKAQQIGI